MGKAIERIFLPLIRKQLPEIADMNLPWEGCFHNCLIVSIRKSYPEQAKKVMHAVWGLGQMMFSKCVIVLDQMQMLKQRMLELQDRMSELSKGIHDEFMNGEALKEMLEEQNLGSQLDEVEKLVREGKADEAVKKMQELAMQMDEFLESLDRAETEATEKADPELVRAFEEFQQNLEETIKKQESLSQRTREIREKYRAQQRERIARQAAALKAELRERLRELDKSWRPLGSDPLGANFSEAKTQALQEIEHVDESLQADDFDLALESAERLAEHAQRMSEHAAEHRRLQEMLRHSVESRKEAKHLHERLASDEQKADEVARRLRALFPQSEQQLSESDRDTLQDLAKQQGHLQKTSEQLEQQMQQLSERAPIFDDEARQQVDQAGRKMDSAAQRLQSRDVNRGFGEQQGALQALRNVQQALDEAGRSGGKGGIPLPLKQRGRRRGSRDEKVAIPDADPTNAQHELRKDIMDAMKQGAPDRYREQNKKYYEELVK
jgi:hypothetical protein